jgi:hypothetical protein
MRNLGTYISIVLFLTITSCGNERLDVDLSETSVPEISINRLEQDIFKMDTTDIAKTTQQLQAKYGRFEKHLMRHRKNIPTQMVFNNNCRMPINILTTIFRTEVSLNRLQ